jgi:outer membrane protein
MKLAKIAAVALATTFLSTGVALAGDGPWQVRFRAVVVDPDDSANITPIGGDTKHSTSLIPELDISYFFSDNISAELVLGVTNHSGKAINTALGTVDLGDVWLLPPTLTLQYHFAPDATVNPYIGAGVNYTIFFSEDLPAGSPLLRITHGNSLGPALQAGFDVKMNEDWFINFDVKKVFINTKATMDAGALGIVRASVDLDPWLFGVGFGRKF